MIHLPRLLLAIAITGFIPVFVIAGARIELIEGIPARLLKPGESTTIAVQSFQENDAPSSDAGLVFVVPSTSGGTFSSAGGVDKSFLRLTTDGSGKATVSFQAANHEGVYLLEVLDENTGMSTGVAISVSSADEPEVSLQDASNAIRQSFPDSGKEHERLRINGPFLLPTGTAIVPAGPQPTDRTEFPRVTREDRWFFWIDRDPYAVFAHPTEYWLAPVTADASLMLISDDEIWWPTVVLPGSTAAVSLGSAAGENRAAQPHPEIDAGLGTILSEKATIRTAAPEDACAIYGYGPDLPGAAQHMYNWATTMVEKEYVPAANTVLNVSQAPNGAPVHVPMTSEYLRAAVKALEQRDCQKIYLFLFAHGMPDYFSQVGGGLQLADGFLPFEELAAILEPLKGRRLCVFLQSCFSGQLIDYLQGLGFEGEIFTAADREHVSFSDPRYGGILGEEMRVSLEFGSSTSLAEAFERSLAKPRGNSFLDGAAIAGSPQKSTIIPDGPQFKFVPPVYIPEVGQVARGFVLDSLAGPTSGTVAVESPAIANVFPAAFLLGLQGGEFAFFGVSPGNTEYRVEYTTASGVQKFGRNTVTVGKNGIFIRPLHQYATPGQTVTYDVLVSKNSDSSYQASSESEIAQITEPLSGIGWISDGEFEKQAISVLALANGLTGIFVNRFRWVNWWDHTGALPQYAERVGSPARAELEIVSLRTNSACDFQGDFTVTLNVLFDPFGHVNFVAMPQGAQTLKLNINGPNVSLMSPLTQLVPATGTVAQCQANGATVNRKAVIRFATPQASRAATAGFEASGRSTGPIAGRQNVLGRYYEAVLSKTGTGPEIFDTLAFKYELGSGSFPGGPITYKATGPGTESCVVRVSPSPIAINSPEGSRKIRVETQPQCGWQATTATPWLRLPRGTTGSGIADLTIEWDVNASAQPRSGTISISGTNFTVNQSTNATDRPQIAGVVHGASFESGLSPSNWVSIFGTNLSAVTRDWRESDFQGNLLPQSLEGVSVTIGGKVAPPSYISPTQLNVLAPDDLGPGPVDVVVTNARGTSDRFRVLPQELSPGMFLFSVPETRYAAAVHADGTYAAKPGLLGGSASREAKPGDILMLYGSGFGETDPPTPAHLLLEAAASSVRRPVITVGGVLAEVQYAGKVIPGLWQFNVVVPMLPPGDHAVHVIVDGKPTQAGVFLTVAAP